MSCSVFQTKTLYAFLVCSLIREAVINWGQAATNAGTVDERSFAKDLEGSGCDQIRHYPRNCLEGVGRTKTNLIQDSRNVSRALVEHYPARSVLVSDISHSCYMYYPCQPLWLAVVVTAVKIPRKCFCVRRAVRLVDIIARVRLKILLAALCPLASTQPLTEMSTRNFLGVKGRLMHKADNITAICAPTV
jgi:hypothetical protein